MKDFSFLSGVDCPELRNAMGAIREATELLALAANLIAAHTQSNTAKTKGVLDSQGEDVKW